MAATPEKAGADKGKPKRGRPSKFTPAIAEEICRRISEGETLRAICRDDHMPHWTTVHDWKDRDEDFSLRLARARDTGYDAIAQHAVEILDEDPHTVEIRDKEGNVIDVKVDGALVQWQKNRAEIRLKLLACWDPRRYGNKVQTELSGPEGKPIETTVRVETGPQLDAVVKAMKAHLGIVE
jgi:hypothetical protein